MFFSVLLLIGSKKMKIQTDTTAQNYCVYTQIVAESWDIGAFFKQFLFNYNSGTEYRV